MLPTGRTTSQASIPGEPSTKTSILHCTLHLLLHLHLDLYLYPLPSVEDTARKKSKALAQYHLSQEQETPRTVIAKFVAASQVVNQQGMSGMKSKGNP